MGKKEKLRVYLQYPWKFTDSTYYKNLTKYPLGSLEYVGSRIGGTPIQSAWLLKLNNFFKQNAKKIIQKICPGLPNAHLTRIKEKYDLIHCAHCLSLNKTPWVCDIEFVGQFWVAALMGSNGYFGKSKVQKILSSEYCKKIMAWTEWSKDGIINEFPEISDKVEIVYPGIPEQKIKKSFSKNISLLFVGRDFNTKGGQIAVEIFDKLTKKYPHVFADVVSDTPSKILQKYKGNKKINFYKLMSHEKLFREIYPKADIFVYPTFSDTFGFAILEAQSFGLPVVATKTQDTHTIREIIVNGKTGFIINALGANYITQIASPDIIQQMTKKIEMLIKNKKMLQEMSKNCIKEIRSGKFSTKRRDEKLKRIYREAVR